MHLSSSTGLDYSVQKNKVTLTILAWATGEFEKYQNVKKCNIFKYM